MCLVRSLYKPRHALLMTYVLHTASQQDADPSTKQIVDRLWARPQQKGAYLPRLPARASFAQPSQLSAAVFHAAARQQSCSDCLPTTALAACAQCSERFENKLWHASRSVIHTLFIYSDIINNKNGFNDGLTVTVSGAYGSIQIPHILYYYQSLAILCRCLICLCTHVEFCP